MIMGLAFQGGQHSFPTGHGCLFHYLPLFNVFTAAFTDSTMYVIVSSVIPHHHGKLNESSHQASKVGQACPPKPIFWKSGKR